MANLTEFVKPAAARGRYPFDRMVEIGDYFDVVPCSRRSLSVTVSHEHHGEKGRHIRVFSIAGGGRVMLVDIAERNG